MKNHMNIMMGAAILFIALFFSSASALDSVFVWYGNVESAPLSTQINERLDIDVFVQTSSSTYIIDVLICLGAHDDYFNDLVSENYGELYYPFTEWGLAVFFPAQGAPPNESGWSSQSFWGSAGGPPWYSPFLHFEEPTLVMKMVFHTVNDQVIIGETAGCLGLGLNHPQGPSNASDTLTYAHPVIQYYSPVYFEGGGWVSGYVTDSLGNALEGTAVSDLQTTRTATTDGDGHYLLGGIYPGNHDILFSAPGYEDTTIYDVAVTADDTTSLDVVIFRPTGIREKNSLPSDFILMQNYPNPFNSSTLIRYELPEESYVTIDIFDVLGQKVASLQNSLYPAGSHKITWNAQGFPTGIYFYRLTAGNYSETKKMLLMK